MSGDDAFDGYDDPMGGPSTERPSVERLLLAIIDAYPDRDFRNGTREERLAAAKKALFNEEGSDGRKRAEDRAALYYMAEQHLKDLQKRFHFLCKPDSFPNGPPEPRSSRALAKEAARLSLGNSKESIVERLRKRFANEKDTWLEMVRSHDFVSEAVEQQVLRRIRWALRPIGIKLKLERDEVS